MDDIPKINQLESVLSQCVNKEKKIVSTEYSRLTAYGENFGSEILKIDLLLKTEKTGKEEDLHVVAKIIPKLEFFRMIFNIQVTFSNEKAFYDTIVPTLQEFQREQGVQDVIDIFPKFYGGRRNLKDDEQTPVDDDGVILLENLKVKGYLNVDRHIGFDLATTKFILRSLAQFHAVPIALKHRDPQTFESKVKAFFACFHPSAPKPPLDKPLQIICGLLQESDRCRHLIPKVRRSLEHFQVIRKDFKEPFATLTHKDFWVNNVMIKFNNSAPSDVKFVDFQMYSYDTPAADLLFFLFTSVETEVMKESLDDLIKYYHQHFTQALRSLNCDLDLTYDGLLDEIAFCTEWELVHIIFMYLFIISGKKGGPPLSPDDIDKITPDILKSVFKESTVNRIIWMLQEFERKGWMNF